MLLIDKTTLYPLRLKNLKIVIPAFLNSLILDQDL